MGGDDFIVEIYMNVIQKFELLSPFSGNDSHLQNGWRLKMHVLVQFPRVVLDGKESRWNGEITHAHHLDVWRDRVFEEHLGKHAYMKS